MRPRSRLLTKGRVMLPTIREGSEETVKDLNEANTFQFSDNSQGLSSEDYLLSICHLAHPTFPNRDVSPQNFHTRQQDAVQQRLRSSRFIGTTLTSSDFSLQEEADKKELTGGLMLCNSDPLEFLYGNQSNLFTLSGSVRKAFVEGRFVKQHGSIVDGPDSIDRGSSSDFPCKNSSCPTLHTKTLAPSVSPKFSSSSSEGRRLCPANRGAEGERLNPAIKQSFISQWISDCRSTWREARVRACMLPAIAEV